LAVEANLLLNNSSLNSLMHMSAQELNVIAAAMAHLCVARRGLCGEAFKVYGQWVEQIAIDMRKNDESMSWSDWFSKFWRCHWDFGSGTTLTYEWRLDEHSGQRYLRSLGFRSQSWDISTSLWKSGDSGTFNAGHLEELED
jgi:hypothetical protein